MLRMEEQKERKTWDPNDIMELLCQPWNAYLWTHGYVGANNSPWLSHYCHFAIIRSQTRSWVMKSKLLLTLEFEWAV